MVKTRPTKKRLPAAERRQTIIDAARQVFLESGLGGARTREIAEKAGITEAMLYRHFASKEELFQESVLNRLEHMITEIVERSKIERSLGKSADEEFVELNRYVLEQMREIVPLLGVALFADQTSGKEFYRKRLFPLLRQWITISEKGLERYDSAFDTDFVFRAYFGMLFSFAMDSVFRGVPLDSAKLAIDIQRLTVNGIAGQPPRRTSKRSRSR